MDSRIQAIDLMKKVTSVTVSKETQTPIDSTIIITVLK